IGAPAQLLGKLPRGFSTRNAEMPLCGFAASTGSVRASTRMASAPSALVHQYLLPVINQSSPSRSARVERSEEHTSELQSLMRISYAVFCLQKKTQLIHDN